ncbi:MAG TPA: hypothetical protein VGR21_08465 [Cryptosporangiaceae bacterium]|nr:hypothetical protein [Cryptosporangiaceae bacterium]
MTKDLHLRGDVQLVGEDVGEQFEVEGVDDGDGVESGFVMVLMGEIGCESATDPMTGGSPACVRSCPIPARCGAR